MIKITKDNITNYTKEDLLVYIKEYINKELEVSRRKTLDEESFNLPSWKDYQAFQLGNQKALYKLLDFLP